MQAATPDVVRMRKDVDAELKPKMDEFKKKGGFVHELTAAQVQAMRRAVQAYQAVGGGWPSAATASSGRGEMG